MLLENERVERKAAKKIRMAFHMFRLINGRKFFSGSLTLMKIIPAILLMLVLPSTIFAYTYTAASCSSSAVQSAISAASSGDTVTIPAGSCTWNTHVNLNKAITVKGAGPASTLLTLGSSANMFFYVTAENARITGIGFTSTDTHSLTHIQFDYVAVFQVDNCSFTASANGLAGIVARGSRTIYPKGVIHNNTFTHGKIEVSGDADCDDGITNTAAINLGTDEAVYVENNTFYSAYPLLDGDYGNRTVFRYNDIIFSNVNGYYIFEQHSIQGNVSVGTRKFEIYNNLISGTANYFGMIRGGTGVIFNNYAATGVFGSCHVTFDNVRSMAPRGTRFYFAYCDGSAAVDGNEAVPNGTGTHTGASGAAALTDNTKSWTTNDYVGKILAGQGKSSGTCNGSASSTILSDSTAVWYAVAYQGLVGAWVKNTTDGSSCLITSNTATTATCSGGLVGGLTNTWHSGDAYSIGMGGWVYNLSACAGATLDSCARGIIIANTGNTVTAHLMGGTRQTWAYGDSYRITVGYPCRGQLGTGKDNIAFPLPYAPGKVYPTQDKNPVYLWSNYCGTSPLAVTVPAFGFVQKHVVSDRDYINGTQHPTYTPYTCPHPLAGAGSCDYSKAGTAGYVVSGPPTPASPTPAPSPTPPTAPSAPSALSAAAVSSRQINLSWTDNSNNEDGFKIERCTNSGCATSTLIAIVPANVKMYSDTGLTANTTYYYRVRAYNSAGSSGYSNTASSKTISVSSTQSHSTANAMTYQK
ncbi:MAG: fibronectin type III domain-containing protein [Syntrophales bacterium]